MQYIIDLIKKVVTYKDLFTVLFGVSNISLAIVNFNWTKKIERYKTELQTDLKNNEVKFSKIYNEKANIIKELYSKSWDLQKVVEKFPIKCEKNYNTCNHTITKNEIKDAKNIASDFSYFFNKNRIFLSEELDAMLCEIDIHVEMFIKSINNGLIEFSKESNDGDESLVAGFLEVLPNIRDELMTEFKKFLEIDQ